MIATANKETGEVTVIMSRREAEDIANCPPTAQARLVHFKFLWRAITNAFQEARRT